MFAEPKGRGVSERCEKEMLGKQGGLVTKVVATCGLLPQLGQTPSFPWKDFPSLWLYLILTKKDRYRLLLASKVFVRVAPFDLWQKRGVG